MRATNSRLYREGNLSVYSESIDHHWEKFLEVCPFEFDKEIALHRWYAEGFVQALFGSSAKLSIEWW